jgi:hypothetical protein
MKSETIDLLATALCAAQGELKNAKINRQNPHFKNRYADLASVRDAIAPTLAKHGLAITQTMEIGELSGGFSLQTMLIHKSGQWVTSEYPLPVNAKPQELGSALTYARRYSLSSIVGIAADDDDDAEMASKANGASAEKITDEQFASLVDMAESVNADRDKLAKYLKVDALVDLPAYRFKEAMSALESKRTKS